MLINKKYTFYSSNNYTLSSGNVYYSRDSNTGSVTVSHGLDNHICYKNGLKYTGFYYSSENGTIHNFTNIFSQSSSFYFNGAKITGYFIANNFLHLNDGKITVLTEAALVAKIYTLSDSTWSVSDSSKYFTLDNETKAIIANGTVGTKIYTEGVLTTNTGSLIGGKLTSIDFTSIFEDSKDSIISGIIAGVVSSAIVITYNKLTKKD